MFRQSFDVETRISILLTSRDQELVFIHLINGKTLQLEVAELRLSNCDKGSYAESCVQLDYINGHLIGLTSSGRVYSDAKEIITGISF